MHTQRLRLQLDMVVNQPPMMTSNAPLAITLPALTIAHLCQQGRPKELALLAKADEEDGEQLNAEPGKRIGP